MNVRFFSVLGLVVGALAYASARPAKAAENAAKERAARKACLSGNVNRGMDILTELYLSTRDTNYIFNQGRCLEQNSRYQDAVAHFREYLLKRRHPTPEETSDTQSHIDTCLSFLGKKDEGSQAEHPAASSSPAPVPPQTPPPTPVYQPQPPIMATTVPVVAQAGTGAGLRTAGVVTGALGLAGVIAGVIFNLQANAKANDLWKEDTASKRSSHENYVTLGWVGYGGGAAFVATGAILYYLGWGAASQSSHVALIPRVGSSGATLLLTSAY